MLTKSVAKVIAIFDKKNHFYILDATI